MIIKKVEVVDYLTKSKLPGTDYVINPYIGCPHACKYCYASFMKRFTNHPEAWGDFVDVKYAIKPISLNKIVGKRVVMSSVTDCYNIVENEYEITKSILEQLKEIDFKLQIITKSDLIIRDLDLIKSFKNVTVCVSLNTLDDVFRSDMDKAASVNQRLNVLKLFHQNGIRTVLFCSPMFPYITDFESIVDKTKEYVDEYWFENLNLRGPYRSIILNYIKNKHNQYYQNYIDIYLKGDQSYWDEETIKIKLYCEQNNITYRNYFHHQDLVKTK